MSQKIYVCIKQVPDTETRIKLNSDNSGLDTSSIKWIISPYDENAIEAALQHKTSKAPEASVVVLSLGPSARVQESLRMALAMGCDEAILVDSETESDSYCAAKALAEVIQKQEGDLLAVYTGYMAIDKSMSSFPQHLGEFLKVAHISKASQIQYEADHLNLTKEITDGSLVTYKASLPCVIGASKELNTPRYPSLPGIMKAKKKPLSTVSLSSLGSDLEPLLTFSNFRLPEERNPAVFIEGASLEETASTLVDKIINEAKAL